jgi:hypothetical protein
MSEKAITWVDAKAILEGSISREIIRHGGVMVPFGSERRLVELIFHGLFSIESNHRFIEAYLADWKRAELKATNR